MLTFNLKKEWYEKIKRGEKTVEYREVKPYWTKRIRNEIKKNAVFEKDLRMLQFFDLYGKTLCLFECKLRLGYTKRFMSAIILNIEKINGKDTDLAVNKPVYAIHLANVREMVKCPHCKGNGAMLDGLGVIECPWCGGDGEWEAAE